MAYFSILPTAVVWWYSRGFSDFMAFIAATILNAFHSFSVVSVIKTLLSPWKRDVGPRRPGIDGLRDWFTDNLVSRGVGFVMRLGILIVFLIYLSLLLIFSFFALALWILWPGAVVLSLILIFS